MSKIADLIEEAGARAEAVPAFARELITALEARIEALEARIEAMVSLNTPRAPDPAKVAKAKAALADAENPTADDAAQS